MGPRRRRRVCGGRDAAPLLRDRVVVVVLVAVLHQDLVAVELGALPALLHVRPREAHPHVLALETAYGFGLY